MADDVLDVGSDSTHGKDSSKSYMHNGSGPFGHMTVFLRNMNIMLTNVHLSHKYEDYRLKELSGIKSLGFPKNAQEKVPHMFLGDFNSLTRRDYRDEEWMNVQRVRKQNKWETPETRLTTQVGFELKKGFNPQLGQQTIKYPRDFLALNIDK